MKRFMILTTLFLGIILAVLVFYSVNQPVSSLDRTTADFSLSSTALYRQFAQDEEAANQQYLGKIIELSGTVTDCVSDDNGQMSLTLDGDELFGVSCKLSTAKSNMKAKIQKGDVVKVKGLCSGKLMDVVLINCSVDQG